MHGGDNQGTGSSTSRATVGEVTHLGSTAGSGQRTPQQPPPQQKTVAAQAIAPAGVSVAEAQNVAGRAAAGADAVEVQLPRHVAVPVESAEAAQQWREALASYQSMSSGDEVSHGGKLWYLGVPFGTLGRMFKRLNCTPFSCGERTAWHGGHSVGGVDVSCG